VLALLLRFYELRQGEILIDGQSISKVSRRSLRQQTAYVGRMSTCSATPSGQHCFGKEGATEDEIIEAAKAACAHQFIMGFPLGYDTPVGEHGAQLSGGQRQRIAVARALIKDARSSCLMRPTAALDSESEKQVQEAIEHLCQNRTTIVIAHACTPSCMLTPSWWWRAANRRARTPRRSVPPRRPLCLVLPPAAERHGGLGADQRNRVATITRKLMR